MADPDYNVLYTNLYILTILNLKNSVSECMFSKEGNEIYGLWKSSLIILNGLNGISLYAAWSLRADS